MDDITMPTPCELHVRAKNISIRVAYGSALPLNPCTTIHGRPIPPGYTSVTVEQIVGNNEDLELASLEGMERRHWETHCTGSFYGARPTSNLLQAQRLPCRPIARLRGLPHRRPHNQLLHHRLRLRKGPRVLQLLLHQKKERKRQHPSQRLDPQRRSRKRSKEN